MRGYFVESASGFFPLPVRAAMLRFVGNINGVDANESASINILINQGGVMKIKLNMKKCAELGVAMTAIAALIAGCGGSSSGTTSLSGTVADGYLSGVKVCLDKNDNGLCDSTEPFATTSASGVYSISGLSAADIAAYAVVAEVPASAVDSDSASAIGQAFTLTAPKGNGVVTPLSSLVYQEMQKDSTLSQASAVANVQTATGISTTINPLDDYIAKGYSDVHNAARVLVNSIKANAANAGSASGKQLNAILMEAALAELQNQGVLGTSGVAVANPASAVVGTYSAAKLAAIAAATQSVTINFDVANGATTGVRCGTPLTINNTLWDHNYSAYASGVPASTASAVPAAAAMQYADSSIVGAQSTAGSMADLRFYISNVNLIDGSGNSVPVLLDTSDSQEKGVALMDFGHMATVNGTTACTSTYKTQIVGKVKPGTYTGLSITLGVPIKAEDGVSRLNHSNQSATVGVAKPLQNTAMAWSWQSGRKFTKIEFVPTTPFTKPSASNLSATSTNWTVHLGSTGCTGNPLLGLDTVCTNPNRLNMTFSSFDLSSNTVVLDVAQLYKKADLTFDAGGSPGCMSGGTDPECAPIFNALGLSMSTGLTVETPVAATSSSFGEAVQTVFSVR
jgi:uncharacterized repeat protein (TIGR04052 family)